MKTEKNKTRVPKKHTGLSVISFLVALCVLASFPFLVPSPVPVDEYSDMLVIPTPEPTPEPTPVPTPEPTPDPEQATVQEPVPVLLATEEPEIRIVTFSEATESEPIATPVEAATVAPVVTPEPTPVPTTAPSVVTDNSKAVTAQTVSIYKESSVQSAKCATLKKGTSVHVYAVSGKWAAVKAGTVKGYIPLIALAAVPAETAQQSSAESTPVSTPTPALTPVPTPTPAPLRVEGEMFDRRGDGSMIVRLPMDDFSGGSKPSEDGYSVVSDRQRYEDESITVEMYQFKYNYTVYSVADVTIADASQLRTAIAGTPSSAARASMIKIADRVNAVVALNGDYYADRKGSYIVRQSQCLSHSLSGTCDLLVIDYDGNFHCIKASEKKEALEALKGNIYQCFNFGPVLIRNGEKQEIPSVYNFGINYMNPRAAIGQLGELHYVLVVASGRLDNSLSITGETMRDVMYKLGCTEAYNLDGGASAEMVYRGKTYSLLTPAGERGLYDIIYFASTAEKEN